MINHKELQALLKVLRKAQVTEVSLRDGDFSLDCTFSTNLSTSTIQANHDPVVAPPVQAIPVRPLRDSYQTPQDRIRELADLGELEITPDGRIKGLEDTI
jgi:hypothetical protein